MNRRRIIRGLGYSVLLLLFAGFGLKACQRPPKEAMRPVELEWWRVFDSENDFAPTIQAFKQRHPNISIRYRRLRFEEYEEELLNALAEDRGPDIISLHNTWLGKYEGKLLPAPAATTLAVQFLRGSLKKELVTELKTTPLPTIRDIENTYLDVVRQDVVRPVIEKENTPPVERIFGLPLSVDTMVLYANRDLLNGAGVPQPARTWSEFQEHVRRLTRIENDRIVQAGAAIGTTKNIPRATDLVMLLMMQNGTEVVDDRGFATFNRIPATMANRQVPPGEEALQFFVDFANPAKETYTWNATLPDALDLFAEGRLAYFFGYAYHLPQIRTRAPKLRLAIVPMPQIEANPEVHFANYWVESVSKKTEYPNEAWGFLDFLTSRDQVQQYLTTVKKPPARRDLITEAANDPDLVTFAQQLLTAKSWYRGKDAGAAEKIIEEMIESVVQNEVDPARAVNFAVGRINQTIR